MRAIVVDDELLMIQKFERLSNGIEDLSIKACFDNAKDAIIYVKNNPVEAAFLDIEMPGINGVDLAKELRAINAGILIVFVTAHEEYIAESNRIKVDYYLLKPYTRELLDLMMENLRILEFRQRKVIYVQTFGRFVVKKNDRPVKLVGRAKEILALLITRRGREISNEQIYRTLWETRTCTQEQMGVYYNALRRLRRALAKEGIADLLITTDRGQMINADMVDCDYYRWLDDNVRNHEAFHGEFLTEYSWGEKYLASIVRKEYGLD